MHNKKNTSSRRSLIRSITGLFGTKKRNVTLVNHKDDNYTHYYVNKKLADGIDFIAQVQQISKKHAAELMIEEGLRSYIALLYKQYVENENKQRLAGQKIYRDRFGRLLRKRTKEMGFDVSNLV